MYMAIEATSTQLPYEGSLFTGSITSMILLNLATGQKVFLEDEDAVRKLSNVDGDLSWENIVNESASALYPWSRFAWELLDYVVCVETVNTEEQFESIAVGVPADNFHTVFLCVSPVKGCRPVSELVLNAPEINEFMYISDRWATGRYYRVKLRNIEKLRQIAVRYKTLGVPKNLLEW